MAVRHFLTHCLLATLVSSAWSHQAAQAEVINWRNNVDAAKVEAGQTGRFVLLHFWTPSCGPCKVLERDVFSQPQLGAFLEKDFVPVKVNADLSPALANAYRIDQVPTDI
ncbi:MAG: thioredoxin family protein [Pirellulales bacterium]|nr:thioredoxin family protein [Pirellulales bacterium]